MVIYDGDDDDDDGSIRCFYLLIIINKLSNTLLLNQLPRAEGFSGH